MRTEIKQIEKIVNDNERGYSDFNTWCGFNTEISKLYFFLKTEFIDNGYNFFNGDNGSYIVYFEHGRSGRGGMDEGSPDKVIVRKVNQYKQ